MSEFEFDAAEADRAEEFFSTFLSHIEGEWNGKPFLLEHWQREIVRLLYATKHKPDGLRRYRRVYIEVPRKNGKSAFSAGLALRALLADREPGAQVYIAAENRRQAWNVYRVASEMVLRNPDLRRITDVLPSTKRITVPQTASFLEVLPGEADASRGINASCIIFEELLTQKDRRLYDMLANSQGARRQPLMVMLTTAGYDPDSLWGQEHDYAVKVRDGRIEDETYLSVIYAADPKAAVDGSWKDPETWKKANPSWEAFGPTLQNDIRDHANRAENAPVFLNAFLRERLNISTRQEVRWMPMEPWDASAGLVVAEDLKGRPCWAGLDLAMSNDLAALALVFSPSDGDPEDSGEYHVLMRFWMPERVLNKLLAISRVPYDTWAAEGFIHVTAGDVIDFAFIEKEILELHERFGIQRLTADPALAPQLIQDLTNQGLTCVTLKQGFPVSAAMKELLRLILAHRLRHGGNPVLRWNADNLVARQDPYGQVRPDKQRSREKIDGAVALMMAIDGAMRNRAEPSVYTAERGIISI